MDRLEECAWISVGRGCGFAGVALLTLMFAFSFHLPLAFKAGGIVALMTCFFLLLKGWQAPMRPYKRTEVWYMLRPEDRPPAAVAQTLIGQTLRRTYFTFALHSAGVASGFFAISLLLAIMFSGTYIL
jgi:hypothetical protein